MMSYNYDFYGNNQNCYTNNWTFQNKVSPSINTQQDSYKYNQQPNSVLDDKAYVKTWEEKLKKHTVNKPSKPPFKIFEIRSQLRNLVKTIEELKETEQYLSENISILSEEEWLNRMRDVHKSRALVDGAMNGISDHFLETFKGVLAKRTAKRIRLKRKKCERKKEKLERLKFREELSRTIDEKLQKMKDEIEKIKKEKEGKLHTDMILRNVHCKKSDAKKCIAKLDALLKLRKARQNTAKGRGQAVNEVEAGKFNESIEQLKTMWKNKLASYELEENEMRLKLKQDSEYEQEVEKKSFGHDTVENLANWKKVLFGGPESIPQADFGGDLDRFISVRSEWDQYISKDGTCLPAGWVMPTTLQS